MASTLPLRAALKHGALVTVANWPVVLIEFAIESLYKLALAVPVVGGAFMVAVLLGADVGAIFGRGRARGRRSRDRHRSSPRRSRSTTFLRRGRPRRVRRRHRDVRRQGAARSRCSSRASARRATCIAGRCDLDALRRAYALRPRDDPRRDARDSARRAGAAGRGPGPRRISSSACGYIRRSASAFRVAESTAWAPAWPLLVLVATSASVVAVTAINLALRSAARHRHHRRLPVSDGASRRLRAFLVADARQVLGIFGVIGLRRHGWRRRSRVVATASLALVGVGAVRRRCSSVPLQAAAWIVRGLAVPVRRARRRSRPIRRSTGGSPSRTAGRSDADSGCNAHDQSRDVLFPRRRSRCASPRSARWAPCSPRRTT